VIATTLVAALTLSAPLAVADDPKPAPKLAFKVAKVVVMDDAQTVHNDAVVLVSEGKIEAVGPAADVKIPEGYKVHDFAEHWLVPGLIDCHDHIAGSLGDLNDMVYLTNPGLDTRSTIEPNNELIKQARRGGVTSVLLIPGSGTNMSGFGTIAKTGGDTPDEVIVRSPGSLKIAQSGNPEWYFGGAYRAFMNWNTRQTLLKARAHHEQWEAFEKGETKTAPEFDPAFDKFRGLFRREFPVSVHTQLYQVVMTSIDMLGAKLKLWVVLDHSELDDVWKLAPLVVEHKIWTIVGPRTLHFDRRERRFVGLTAAWHHYGAREIGINTDAPVIPQQELFYQGTIGCWYGFLPYLALRGVTQVPAKALGIYDQTGSIEVGKAADFGVWGGDPIDPRSACRMTVVNGRIVYDASKPGPFGGPAGDPDWPGGPTGRRRFQGSSD
jgi:imidazolonepropionase-like amidohydrolase